MTMTPGLRKFVLIVHLTSSLGWLGAAAGFLALAVAGLTSPDAQMVRAVYLAAEPITWFVLVPLSLASLLTGLVMSLGTPWGLFRHYWVLVKLLVTVFATVVLLLQMGQIGHLADAAAETTVSGGELRGARGSLVVHASGGLVTLLVPLALSVYKPKGVTRYGLRKRREERPPARP